MLKQLIVSKKTCLFVQWTRPICRYLLVSRSQSVPRVVDVGSFQTDDQQPLVEQLHAHAASRNLRFRQAVVLLPRAELDVTSLNLPPATAAELPELVKHAVIQETDDAGLSYVSDFIVTRQADDASETLAFSCDEKSLDALTAGFKSAGTNLCAVTFGGFGAGHLLKQISRRPAPTAVVITTSDHDIDLAVQANGRPLGFRTIPRSMEEEDSLAERLSEEIRRTLAIEHRPDDGSTRLYLIGDVEEHQQLAKVISERLSLSVSVVNPVDQVETDIAVKHSSRYANLVGIACAWNGCGLELDLLHPRQAVTQPGLLRRIAFWGTLAATVLLILGSLVWQDRAEQINAIDKQRDRLSQLTKRANKALEQQDVVDAIHLWRTDDIVWLDELRELSERLPSRHEALIRTINMSADSQRNGVIDMDVQVSRPEVVAGLEDALRNEQRSVSSKRVSETAGKTDLPWHFETRIVFIPDDVPPTSIPDSLPQKGSAEPFDQTKADSEQPQTGTRPVLTENDSDKERTFE